MTEPSTSPHQSGHFVTAVLVSHDGAQWLPEVLDSLAAQTLPPDRFVAVDTGSADSSVELVTAAIGANVLSLPEQTPFGDAVQAGLDSVTAGPAPADEADDTTTEWVWLLHDDCAPDPFALEELILRVTDSPSVWLVGPKVRGWDGARLLEAGLTIDATGQIDAGFDGLELDQGQRDDVDEVLAVSTAGALIRRDVWDRLGGLDRAWSSYGDDVDLGWRVNAAGGRVVVATKSIVRHVRAQTVGQRQLIAGTGSVAAVRRRSGMQVVLTNTSPWLVPILIVRYIIGGLLRAAGFLVIARRPSRAGAELVAVFGVLTHPVVVVTGRRDRARSREVPHHELHRLFPSAASRWRSSPFRVGRLGVGRVVSLRRSAAVETGPVSEESESLVVGDSVVARFLSRPTTVLFFLMVLLALIAERHVESKLLHGGRLLPAPNGASDLWSTYLSTWHPSSVGSVTPAPPSLGILAALSTIAFGKAWLVVDVIVLGVVPLAALSAFTATRALTSAVRVRIWVAIVYSLLPAVTGAVAGGRIDVAVVAIVLPQVIRVGVAAVNAGSIGSALRRGAGAGLLLALAAAFAPGLWLVALAGLVVGLGFMELDRHDSAATVRRLVAAAVILVVPVVVLVPWSLQLFAHPRLALLGSGLPEFYTSHDAPSGFSLAMLRAGGPAQPPIWIGIPIVAAALLGLNRQSRVAIARTGVALLVIGVAVAVALTRGAGVTDGLPASRHWPGTALLVAAAGALLAALVAAVGARPALRGQSFGWRQPAAVVLVLIAVVSTVTLAASWVVRGAGPPLTSANPRVLPLFIQSELAATPTSPRALVLTVDGPQVSYALVRRAGGPQLGDADTAPRGGPSAAQLHLDSAVRDLVAGRPGAGNELATFGIGFVVAPTGSAPGVASALGRATTLTMVPAPGSTVWRSSLPTSELSVLSPSNGAQALRGVVPAAPAAMVLAAAAGSADVTLPAGAPGRVAVLAEPANSRWTATVDGRPLAARTAYGWAQAFVLPAAGGRLRIGFRSGTRHVWLGVELAAIVIVLGMTVPGRRPDDEEGAA
jgi:GT2 family glycosyltransferase